MDADRKLKHDALGAIKAAFSTPDHPGITHAMDVAARAIVEIMHRDEMQNALLAVGAAGKILDLSKR